MGSELLRPASYQPSPHMRFNLFVGQRAGYLTRSLLIAACLTAFNACGGDAPTDPGGGGGGGGGGGTPTTAITATAGNSQSKLAGTASDEMRVRVTTDGAPVANATVAWSTTGGQLASATSTTNADGIAVNTLSTVGSTAGTVTVTAVSSGATASFAITVTVAPSGPARLDYGPDFVVVEPGTTSTAIVATLRDGAGQQVTTPTVTYVSRTPAIATVNASGQVTAVAKGQAIIVATTTASNQTFTDSLLAVVPVTDGPVVMTDLARFDLKTDTTFTVAVFANMRTSASKVGSGKVTLTWDPTVLTYQSNAEGANNVGASVNANGAATGSLVMAFASSAGWSGKVEIRKVTFKASATAAKLGALTIAANEMFAAAGYADLLPKTVTVVSPLYTR